MKTYLQAGLFFLVLLAVLYNTDIARAEQPAGRHTISGFIYEQGSRESLIGATIYVPELRAGTSTNNYGFYSITLPAGEVEIVFTVIQLLPGVQSGQEGSGGFYVRGGAADQNLIILDDAIVYNASHLFGFFSIFNGDAIKNIQLYKGGFPARFGGRLSSVLDISMKDGSKEKLQGEAGIGLVSSRLMPEGPLFNKKASFLVSGRRTYIDALLLPFMPRNERGGYCFYDLNTKLHYERDPSQQKTSARIGQRVALKRAI